MKRHALLAAALLLSAALLPVQAMTVARGGRTDVRVILAADATPAERTAAKELVSYLERATTARFALVPEGRRRARSPAIWVGPTVRSRAAGIDAGALGGEEWRIRTIGDELILVGGRPRGTLYAVYRFLEDHVGVRWWNPFEEHVPLRKDLEVEIDAAGRPAFAYRDIQGVRGPVEFHARSRANGNFSFLTQRHGGAERYGPPAMAHTFSMYLPAEEYFSTHPEFYSERDGRRVGKRAQLCLTSDAVFEIVRDKLVAYIEQARTEARREGREAPRLFSISQNDWRRPCTCDACRAVDDREGSHSGSLVHLLNRLADSIAETHPEVLLDTLAYDYTFQPPRNLRLRRNAVVRVADLQYRDFSKPVTHRQNRTVRRAIETWGEHTEHLRIWAYTVTFGHRPNNLPLPNETIIAEDLRFYLDQGAEGLFVQHEHPIHADMRDLKLWILLKLVENPHRDVEGLIVDFTEGYYGPAAGTIREYRRELARAARRHPSEISHPTHYEQFRYLTPAFLRQAQALFDRAQREVTGNPLLMRRVYHARLALDRATLLLWDDELGRKPERPDAGPALESRVVARRLRDTAHEQIGLRVRPSRRSVLMEMVDTEIAETLAKIAE
jgi:hypothetical protein